MLGGAGAAASPTGQTIGSFLDNAGWYDDISDGPVTATVTINATGDTFPAAGAWVLVAPPKFAPQLDNVVTLYDRLYQMGVDAGWLAHPATPSYTADVWPILQRARDVQWVRNVFGAHTWADPVYNQATAFAIVQRLKNPSGGGSNMPQLTQAALTPTQYGLLQKWAGDPNGPVPQDFTQDWAGPPAAAANVTPADLDRSALTACVGAAFFPGIEAGGEPNEPIVEPGNFVGAGDPMRLDHASVGPGDMSQFMALPWHADFKACGTNWWPVPRPNDVIPRGGSAAESWDRDVGSMLEMVSKWHTLGFVVKQGDQYVEVDRCDTSFITLLTPHLSFQQVPQGPMGMPRKTALAVAFEVRSTGAAVIFTITTPPAHPRLKLDASSVSVGPTIGDAIATARLWVIYETGLIGELVTDSLTVSGPDGQTWTVTIAATTAARQIAAIAMVLDRSGSMSEDRGDGQTKHDSLQEAASIFVDVMVDGDLVGLAPYDQDAQPTFGLATLGPASDPFDTARSDTKSFIAGPALAPGGATSIGDGIVSGRSLLSGAPAAARRSLVVLTDGKENRPAYISEVAGGVDAQTYAVGLGTPQNTSAAALQTLSGNNGGYLLVTGAISGDNRFILKKYFLQILAGISNADIVLDPDGELFRGQEQRIPFRLTEADSGIDAILLTDHPEAVNFRLETPTGQIIAPWRARAEPSMAYRLAEGVIYYRIALPTELTAFRFDQAGTWNALLSIGRPEVEPPADRPGNVPGAVPGIDRRLRDRSHLPVELRERLAINPDLFDENESLASAARSVATPSASADVSPPRRIPSLPYSFLVHAYSNLSFRAEMTQTGFEPGATATIYASLAESGIPPRPGASVFVDITRPDGTLLRQPLQEEQTGTFIGTVALPRPGVHRFRVRASGRSRAGHAFAREQTLTAAVWQGGAHDADPSADGLSNVLDWLDERDRRFCELLGCTLGSVLTPDGKRQLEEHGVDLQALEKCLAVYCRTRDRPSGRRSRDG